MAVGLSRLGHRAGWVGRLGDDEFGKEILAFARGEGVDVSRTSLDSEAPTGLYFMEWRLWASCASTITGRARRRAGCASTSSTWSTCSRGEILHLTGITAALSRAATT